MHPQHTTRYKLWPFVVILVTAVVTFSCICYQYR